MCASTAAKVGAVAWFLALVVGFPLLVNRHPGAFPEWLPSWFFLAVVAAGFAGGGLLLKGLDLWRWHRLATSMGLERMGDAAAEEGFNPLEAYHGTFEGRQVTLDHVGNQSSEASDWTRVAAAHDGDPGGRLVVRERGLGGVPDSEFPPAVEVRDDALSDRFHVYCADAALAREVLAGPVPGTARRRGRGRPGDRHRGPGRVETAAPAVRRRRPSHPHAGRDARRRRHRDGDRPVIPRRHSAGSTSSPRRRMHSAIVSVPIPGWYVRKTKWMSSPRASR